MSKTPFESFDKFDQDDKFPHKSSRKILNDMQDNFDGVLGIVAGPGIAVDSMDPSYPIVSALFVGSGDGGGSGGLWVKAVAKQNIESVENDVMYTEKTVYGGIKSLTGNALNIRLTIAALPGSNAEGGVIQAYVVPGSFTPSNIVQYPAAVDTPVDCEFVRMYVNDEDDPTNSALDQVDHMEFTVDLTVSSFVDGKAQVVVLSDSGAYVVLEYTEENIAHLLTANITTPYTEIAAYRTGFTDGDTVTLTFTADATVYSLFVWPFDATSESMGWAPVEYVLGTPVEVGNTGTVSVQIKVTTAHLANGYVEAGKLYVSASRYHQPTLVIQTTDEFTFDQRTPTIGSSTSNTYNYNGAQEAMKAAETCVVTVPSFNYTHQFTVNIVGTTMELTAPGPFSVTAGSGSFTVQRTGDDFTGVAHASVEALNFNNGKTASTNTSFISVDIEGATYDPPVLVVNGGNPVFSYPSDPTSVNISITSDVKLSGITGAVTLDGITITTPWTSNNGYTWTAQGVTSDAATRGSFTATVGGLTTAAGTAVGSITGGYVISGFTERPVTISTPFSPTLDLTGIVEIDYAAGLTVKDIAFQSVAHTVLGNEITFTDPDFYEANATGTVFVYVAQTPAP